MGGSAGRSAGRRYPWIGCLRLTHKAIEDISEIDDGLAEPFEIEQLDVALRRPWPDEHYFVAYQVTDGTPENPWPRCKKKGPALAQFRARQSDLLMTCLVYDFDNPGHARTSPELRQEFLAKLAAATAQVPVLGQWSFRYFTRGGARVIYVLEEPVPVDVGEGYWSGLRQAAAESGLWYDPKCKDWTRLFMLPYVIRDDDKKVPTWEQDYSGVVHQGGMVVSADEVPWLDPGAMSIYGHAVTAGNHEKPEPEVVQSLVEHDPRGRETMTAWHREAKRRLKGRDCYPCIFSNAAIAKPPEERLPHEIGRDDTIHEYVGQAMRLLHHVEGSSRELVYALFLPAVQQLAPDADTADWTDVLWRAVCLYWSAEDAKAVVEQAKLAQDEQRAGGITQSVQAKFYKWFEKCR